MDSSLPHSPGSILRRMFADGGGSSFARAAFLRGMGLVYLMAITSWWVQADALVGSGGLTPMAGFLEQAGNFLAGEERNRWTALPTLFWFNAGDGMLTLVCTAGTALALLVVAGVAPGPCLLGLWIVYLSLVTTGGIFMSYQWDILLLEAGALATLAAPWRVTRMRWKSPPSLGWGEQGALWLCWFAVAKLMFQSGWVKLAWATAANPEWWPDHSALTFHYMTQPIPTWTAWWMHQLPAWFHEVSIWPMYFVELVLPFLVFLGARLRLMAALGFAGLMLLILATGNYTYFNWLTIVLCVPLVADRFWRLPRRTGNRVENGVPENAGTRITDRPPAPIGRTAQLSGLGIRTVPLLLLAILNLNVCLRDWHGVSEVPGLEEAALPGTHLPFDLTPAWTDELSSALAPFHLVSGYGLFRTMTTDRPEIIIEGSTDGSTWREYDVRWKPDRLSGKPRFVAPHQPRAAWQFWFAALERRYHPRSRNAPWMTRLLRGLLHNDPTVLRLFRDNPFPDDPPRFLRARLYTYEFTSRGERRRSGDWWTREPAGDYLPAISKDNFQ
jgi:hypothetical protein